jgi:hypothetical protein
MISAVFDATTLLQAATSRNGPAAGCLALVDDGHVRLFLSDGNNGGVFTTLAGRHSYARILSVNTVTPYPAPTAPSTSAQCALPSGTSSKNHAAAGQYMAMA